MTDATRMPSNGDNRSELPIGQVRYDSSIYPRAKWSSETVKRYVDALKAGDTFPPIVLEADPDEDGRFRLLDGKHRLEAHKSAELDTIRVEFHRVPDGTSPKLYAASLSARHGDRMSNADLKALAREVAEDDLEMDAAKVGRLIGCSQQTVHGWVSDILNRHREEREAKIGRLSRLGWTQKQIGKAVGLSQPQISESIGITESGDSDIRDMLDRGIPTAEVANRLNMPEQLVLAAALDNMDDQERLNALDIKIQPYDVWQFAGCHDHMGDSHPGRIPGQLVAHVLYFYTQPGDLVIDPMAGSGTTLDACLLMGRKARGYDIDARHERIDVEHHNLDDGWPDTVAKAKLIFWDPPYFDKMDAQTIGDDGYIEGSISNLDPDQYLDWFAERFQQLHNMVKPGTRLAFLMSDWDPENAKRHADHPGIFVWDYATRIQQAGWTLERHIQTPLSTQQVHPDIVNKFRKSRRLARLERYLLVARA